MNGLLRLTVLTLHWLPFILGTSLQNFTICCDYCRGDQDLWVTVFPRWNLTMEDTEVTDFHTPAAFLPLESRHAVSTVFGRDYLLHYSGAPIFLQYQLFSDSSSMLTDQYIELDLQKVHDVVGLNVQGGFYLDTEDDLFPRRDVWVTEMIVSYSTSGASYTWVKTSGGSIQRFSGTSDSTTSMIVGFTDPVQARYVRVHPITAEDMAGSTQHALLRVSPVTCSMDSTCMLPRSNCVVNEWQEWSACTCSQDTCANTRKRSVARYEACGGTHCPDTSDWQECVPEEPMWKTIALYAGIGGGVLLLLIIIIIVVVKMKKKNTEPEVFVPRSREPKTEKAAPRELRKDLKEKELEELDETDAMDDVAEKQLIADTGKGGGGAAAVVNEEEEKKPKEKKSKKGKKNKKNEEKKDEKKKVTWNENELERTKSHESLGVDMDGMYMVKRDEMVSNQAPKPVGPSDVSQDAITPRQVDVQDVKTPRNSTTSSLPPPRGAPTKDLPPIGGPANDPFGAKPNVPPVRNSAVLNDFGDDDEMAILNSIGKTNDKPKANPSTFDDDDFEKEFAEFL